MNKPIPHPPKERGQERHRRFFGSGVGEKVGWLNGLLSDWRASEGGPRLDGTQSNNS